MIWTSLGPGMIAQSIKRYWAEAENNRQVAFDERENWYYGGPRPLQYITQNAKEKDDAYARRKKYSAHYGYVGFIGRQVEHGVYGHDVKRELVDSNETAVSTFAQIYEDSRIQSMQRVIASSQVLHGGMWSVPAFDPRTGKVVLKFPAANHVYAEADESDAYSAQTVIECRPNPTKPKEPLYWIWTKEAYGLFDANGVAIPWESAAGTKKGWIENPYRVIPYTYGRAWTMIGEFYGQPILDDAIQINKLINNRASQLSRIILYQAHAQPVFKGKPKEVLPTGETEAIVVDPEGDFFYRTPGAEIVTVQATIDRLEETLLALNGIPASAIRGGDVASGFALTVQYRLLADTVRDLKCEAQSFEMETARKTCIVGREHGLGLPEQPEIKIEMPDSMLPHDRQAERDADRLDWQAGVMTTEDYVTRWTLPKGASPETVAEYVAKLGAQGATKAAQTNPFYSAPPEQRTSLL